mmetsp:Transcript_67081/g.178942  ORF Transcript_67081/g.178942 Transcript_67081/m.178942 type:complete len:167 (-) Transcript_67081:166-666(-)
MEAFKRLRSSTTATNDSDAGVSVVSEGGTKRIAVAPPIAVSPPGSYVGSQQRGGQGYSTRSGTVTPVTPTRHTWAQEDKATRGKLPQPLSSPNGFLPVPATRNERAGSAKGSSGALTPRQASQAMLHNMDELLANLERQKAAIDLGETWARKQTLHAELEALRAPQ